MGTYVRLLYFKPNFRPIVMLLVATLLALTFTTKTFASDDSDDDDDDRGPSSIDDVETAKR